jgi:hypothetical protein
LLLLWIVGRVVVLIVTVLRVHDDDNFIKMAFEKVEGKIIIL